jgi:hypothetical protein
LKEKELFFTNHFDNVKKMEKVIATFIKERNVENFTQAASECMLRFLSCWGRNLEFSLERAGELRIYVIENFRMNRDLRDALLELVEKNKEREEKRKEPLTEDIVFSLYKTIINFVFEKLDSKEVYTDYHLMEYVFQTRTGAIFDIEEELYEVMTSVITPIPTNIVDNVFKETPTRSITFNIVLTHILDRVTKNIESSPFKARYERSITHYPDENLKLRIAKNLYLDIIEQIKSTQADILTLYDLYLVIQNSESFPLICELDLFKDV